VSTALDLVYQYRQLAQKCDAQGLAMPEIELMQTIEALFTKRDRVPLRRRGSTREPVQVSARLRARGQADAVAIENLGLGGMVCRNSPYFHTGETIEIVIDDRELGLSYRFKAHVIWRTTQEDDDYTIGLRFVGAPLLLRYSRGPATKVAAIPPAA
jgi:hypothetical protein